MEIGYDNVLKSLAKVQDVKLFTKASQCRFGWEGSKIATKEDVEEAIKKEDHGKLLTIMPEATDLTNRDELEHLPVRFDMLKQTKAITDCAHEFFPSKSNLAVQLSAELLQQRCDREVSNIGTQSYPGRDGGGDADSAGEHLGCRR